jgi:hypothetical protein
MGTSNGVVKCVLHPMVVTKTAGKRTFQATLKRGVIIWFAFLLGVRTVMKWFAKQWYMLIVAPFGHFDTPHFK